MTVRAPNGGDVFAIALGHGSVWATNYVGGTLTRLDDDSGAPIDTPIPTGAQPKGVAVGEGAVWVANAGTCTISRVAP